MKIKRRGFLGMLLAALPASRIVTTEAPPALPPLPQTLEVQKWGHPITIPQELLDEHGITLDDLVDAYFTGKRL